MGFELLKPGSIVASLVFALMGVAVFWLCFVIIDKITPYNLWNEVVEKQNVALALVVAAMSLGICIIVAAAIHGETRLFFRNRPNPGAARRAPHALEVTLLASVFVVAACG